MSGKKFITLHGGGTQILIKF